MTYRGNLKEKRAQAGEGRVTPAADTRFDRGGEVEMRDDHMRSKAETAMTPHAATSKVETLPGKPFTGRGGVTKRKRHYTAQDAAAVLGKRC